MLVALNKCFGGFGLSDKAAKLCIERGMTSTTIIKGKFANPNADFCADDLCPLHESDEKFRSNPILVEVVTELGDEANGPFAKLKVIDIPFDTLDGWHIHEYDGIESIHANHASW